MSDEQLPQNGMTDGFVRLVAGPIADTIVAGGRVLLVGMDRLEVERFLADWLDDLDEHRVEYEAIAMGSDYRITQTRGRITAIAIEGDAGATALDLDPRQETMVVVLPTSSMTEQAEQALARSFAQIVRSLPHGGSVATRVAEL